MGLPFSHSKAGGGARTTEKLSAKGDDSGKRKRRDGSWANNFRSLF